jgi:hypothetical protein
MKYQGHSVSLDVHYNYSNAPHTWPMVRDALLSLKPLDGATQQADAADAFSPADP